MTTRRAEPAPRPTHEEDAALRRWQFFTQLGATLAPAVRESAQEIRSRDARHSVREPHEQITIYPPDHG